MSLSYCPFCHLSIPSRELERHADNHFEEDDLARDVEWAQQIAFAPPSPAQSLDHHGSVRLRLEQSSGSAAEQIDEKVFNLISLQTRSSFHKIEDGLIALLRNCLEADSENSISLLSGHVDHFQSIESDDIGWGCGWRNIQMLSSHLLTRSQEARKVLFGGAEFVPDIASLQRWLEIAWERGFDKIGSADFDKKIYGSTKWIGTTECATLFRSFGIKARIMDFGFKEIDSVLPSTSNRGKGVIINDKGKKKSVKLYGPMDKFVFRRDHHDLGTCSTICSSDDGIVDKDNSNKFYRSKSKGQQVLIDWVWNYFSDSRFTKSGNHSVIVSEKVPLYFQHDGHSRTIIGIQVKHQRSGMQQYNLLILDPAQKTAALERSLKEKVGWQKLIKRGMHTLKNPQYQLCYIDPGIAQVEELEQLKILDSVFHEF